MEECKFYIVNNPTYFFNPANSQYYCFLTSKSLKYLYLSMQWHVDVVNTYMEQQFLQYVIYAAKYKQFHTTKAWWPLVRCFTVAKKCIANATSTIHLVSIMSLRYKLMVSVWHINNIVDKSLYNYDKETIFLYTCLLVFLYSYYQKR